MYVCIDIYHLSVLLTIRIVLYTLFLCTLLSSFLYLKTQMLILCVLFLCTLLSSLLYLKTHIISTFVFSYYSYLYSLLLLNNPPALSKYCQSCFSTNNLLNTGFYMIVEIITFPRHLAHIIYIHTILSTILV